MWIMVAGPYRTGTSSDAERAGHARHLNAAAHAVFRKGHLPIVGINLALPIIESGSPDAYEEIMPPISRALASRCDGILRLAGASTGADEEVRAVRTLGGAVYHHLGEVPEATAPSESVIREYEARLRAAMRGSNVDELDRLLSDRLVFTHHQGGVIGKADDLAAHRAGLIRITRMEPSDEHVLLLDGAAIVTVRVEMAGSIGGNPANGAFRFMRVWAPGPHEGWQVVAGQATLVPP